MQDVPDRRSLEYPKLYEPGQRYVQYVSSLPAGPDASSEPKAG
jgi:hypothetical protein